LLLFCVGLVSAVDYPSYQSYVNDYAEIIDDSYEAQIESLARQIEQETTAEIAVLTVKSLEGLDALTYGVEVFEEWGIGKKDVDNGLLILVGLKEREWRIEVGYGLEPVITDAMAGRIGRNTLVPNFKNEEYGKGIYEAASDIQGYIRGEEEVVSMYKSSEKTSDFEYIYVIFFIVLIVGGLAGLITRKINNKKIKWGVRLGIGAAVFISLIFWSWLLAIVFLVLYILMGLGSGGSGAIFFGPRFGGGSGGFGGFGGGMSGGGGAGGRW